jgi:hypothetical protein
MGTPLLGMNASFLDHSSKDETKTKERVQEDVQAGAVVQVVQRVDSFVLQMQVFASSS